MNIDDVEKSLTIHGQAVRLVSAIKNEKIKDAKWLIMTARGFTSEQEARAFAHQLKASVELAAVTTRLGADCGTDKATSAISQAWRDELLKNAGMLVRNNIHGVDVFEDDERLRFISMSAQGDVLANPAPFLDGVVRFHCRAVAQASKRTQEIILLLNFALMNTEPVAQIIFAISAVEMIGQDEQWSPQQKALITQLAAYAKQADNMPQDEAHEVADAISRNLHKLSLRQGVLRLLKSLDLNHLKNNWDDLYAQRSRLVHGLAPRPGVQYHTLAQDTLALCGHILLRVIAREIEDVDRLAQRYYAVSPRTL